MHPEYREYLAEGEREMREERELDARLDAAYDERAHLIPGLPQSICVNGECKDEDSLFTSEDGRCPRCSAIGVAA